MKLVALMCSGCAANLEVASDVETVRCSYCGIMQQVERRGDTVKLRRLTSTVQRIQVAAERTAAELAIPRLEREIREAEVERVRMLAEDVPGTWGDVGKAIAALGFLAIGVYSIFKDWGWWAPLACFVGTVVVPSGGGKKIAKDRQTNADSDAKVARLKSRLEEQRRVVG